jgi:tRNA (cmo5U34)-methyltransferase
METERIRDHFRVQVTDYPDLMKRLIPFYDEQREIMLGLVPFDRAVSIRVLDLGCGPGLMAAKILSAYPNARLTAFDLTEEMLTACRERLGEDERVVYQVGDFRRDPIGGNYDLIIASLSLHHLQLSERPAFFERAFRSLQPGGLLIAAEVIVDEDVDVRRRQYAVWQRFIAQNGENAEYWFTRHLQKDHPAVISDLLAMLRVAGFHQAGCFWRYLNFAIIAAMF